MSSIRSRLQEALTNAMKERDRAATSALRSALAAIDNAGAVEAAEPSSEDKAVESSPAGAGVTDVDRRPVSESEVAKLVLAEIEEREQAALTYRDIGQSEAAEALIWEAAVLRQFI